MMELNEIKDIIKYSKKYSREELIAEFITGYKKQIKYLEELKNRSECPMCQQKIEYDVHIKKLELELRLIHLQNMVKK